MLRSKLVHNLLWSQLRTLVNYRHYSRYSCLIYSVMIDY